MSENRIELVLGQDGVIGNTRGCGPLNPGSIPGPDPSPKKGIFKENWGNINGGGKSDY